VVRGETVRWVCAPGSNFTVHRIVPLLSFGNGWAYRSAIESLLDEAGIDYRVALECPTVGGVQSAVEAGLGVAALNERNMTDQMVEWAPGAAIGVPAVCSVIRSADSSGEDGSSGGAGQESAPGDGVGDLALAALRRELASQFDIHDEIEGQGV